MTSPKLPKTLLEAARSGRLIPFVGAGVSMAVCRTDGTRAFPSWSGLLAASAERLDDEAQTEHAQVIRALLGLPRPDYFEIAKRAREGLGPNWRRFLVEQLAPARAEIADDSLAPAKAIWALGSKLVITTNYDRVLSWACPRGDDLRQWRIRSEADLVDMLGGRLDRPCLWQLHGSIDDPAQLILTPDGYRELYGEASQQPRYEAALTGLRNVIAAHHLLFVGFSLDDEYVARQFEWVRETFRGCDGPHYVLVRAAELARVREKLEGTGVHAITFDDFGEPQLKLLRQIATASDAVTPLGSDESRASIFEGKFIAELRENGRAHVNIPDRNSKSSSPVFGARGPNRAVEPSEVGVDVAILVALEEEFKELEAELGNRWEPRQNTVNAAYDYFWTDERGGYRCVATFVGKMGPQEAVVGAMRLLSYQPAALVNIGIAAGLHKDVRIGDVVVPDLVQAYDKTGKASEDGSGWTWQVRPDAFRPEYALVEEAKHLRMARRASYFAWQAVGASELTKIETSNSAAVSNLLAEQALRLQPEVRLVPLASGCFVVASRSFAEWIRQQNADLMATEMEAAGMMLSATKQRAHVQTLVIRGISDHVCVPKSKTDALEAGALRGLAMRNAWRLFQVYLAEGLLPRASAAAAPIPSSMKSGNTEKVAELEQERDRRLVFGESTIAIENEILTARRLDRDGRPPTANEVLSDRYELLEHVGSGGFATVWRAHDRSKGRVVAVKVLHGQWMHEQSRVERFMSGARRLQAFRHQSIVGVLEDPVFEGDRCYYAMEWLPGGDLRRAVQAKVIDQRQALTAVAQALTGLSYAHERGVIHRDIKPGNILLDKDGRGRLSDFDLAHAPDSTHGTRTGGLGTFAYAAPEQLHDASRVDARADIYGAGMTVLFALLGKDPLPMVAALEPELLDELPCGPTLRRAVREAVAYKAGERATSCERLIAAIFDEPNGVDGERAASQVAPRDDGFRESRAMPSRGGRLEEIVENLLDGVAAELVNEDPIASLIAETNAAGYYADEIVVLRVGEVDFDTMEVAFEAAMHFAGDQDEERMFYGNGIDATIEGVIQFDGEWIIQDYNVVGEIRIDEDPEDVLARNTERLAERHEATRSEGIALTAGEGRREPLTATAQDRPPTIHLVGTYHRRKCNLEINGKEILLSEQRFRLFGRLAAHAKRAPGQHLSLLAVPEIQSGTDRILNRLRKDFEAQSPGFWDRWIWSDHHGRYRLVVPGSLITFDADSMAAHPELLGLLRG